MQQNCTFLRQLCQDPYNNEVLTVFTMCWYLCLIFIFNFAVLLGFKKKNVFFFSPNRLVQWYFCLKKFVFLMVLCKFLLTLHNDILSICLPVALTFVLIFKLLHYLYIKMKYSIFPIDKGKFIMQITDTKIVIVILNNKSHSAIIV